MKKPVNHREAKTKIKMAIRKRAAELDLTVVSLPPIVRVEDVKKRVNQREAETKIRTAIRKRATGLDLAMSGLTECPELLGSCANLRTLDLSGNNLARLPASLGQLERLRSLDLSRNQLTELPKFLGQLTQLQSLCISENRLKDIPASLGLPASLTDLAIDRNELTHLPESFGQLVQLKELSIESNALSHLPDSIGHLPRLTVLAAADNQLASLPASMRRMPHLRRLDLHGNAKLKLPNEVLGPRSGVLQINAPRPQSAESILEYYFRARQAGRPLNEAKLILVGHGAVGKTSLVNRLVNDTFNANESKTPGIKISDWDLLLNQSKEQVRLNIWDFGGQEIMHSTHQFFLTERSLYLVVLNGRQGREDADADYWLSLVNSFSDGSPVIVVMNKVLEQPFELNRRALQQKFPEIRGFVQTDCKEGGGIGDLQRMVMRETDRLSHLRDIFPDSWFSIKDRLTKIRRNYLTFAEFRRICRENSEPDEKAQTKLAGYLHVLGIALNYADDTRLRDTHVLKPRWVTNGVYTIINSQTLSDQKGEFRTSDLAQILDPKSYPPDRHNFLVDLMRKFELCLPFLDLEKHDTYLVPQLLAKEEPEETREFEPRDCLNFEYQYPIRPEGVMARFIVRTRALSSGQPRWRDGVILKWGRNRALVKADLELRNVTISVDGPVDKRARLLAVIRSDFDRIHSSFTFDTKEMVPIPNHPDKSISYKELEIRESKGLQTFSYVLGNDVVNLNVQALLNGVDVSGERTTPRARVLNRRDDRVRLFYSYAHKDERFRDELETHLKLLVRRGVLHPWHDRKIPSGTEWEGEIDDNLERADIILLLVSANFFESDYCYDTEMRGALARHDASKATVVPIIVTPCQWQKAPFSKLQALPPGKPVTEWPSRDAAWSKVAQGIERLAENIIAKRNRESKSR